MGQNNYPDISIVYRALNEEKWFEASLVALQKQVLNNLSMEIVLVDSGSTDSTLAIARRYSCRITHIKKESFSFGRSLNQGCDYAKGKYLVFISAHCIPGNEHWLQNLVQPLIEGAAVYTYGRQVGHDVSHFSEKQIFNKYFPEQSNVPQEGFFCNNANAAIIKSIWQKYKFDEKVTGLEDMVLGKCLHEDGYELGYIANASVIHVHEETFKQTQRRYYREALTLRDILPDVHMSFADFLRYLSASIRFDLRIAKQQAQLRSSFWSVIRFRLAQYWGAYKGHNEIKKLSRAQKESYYYPDPQKRRQQPADVPPKIIKRAKSR